MAYGVQSGLDHADRIMSEGANRSPGAGSDSSSWMTSSIAPSHRHTVPPLINTGWPGVVANQGELTVDNVPGKLPTGLTDCDHGLKLGEEPQCFGLGCRVNVGHGGLRPASLPWALWVALSRQGCP